MMRTLRIVLGIVVGYIVSLTTSILFFLAMHHSPASVFSTKALILCAISGTVWSILSGYLAAWIGKSRISAYGVAIIIAGLSIWGILEATASPRADRSLATTWIALLLMAPSAVFGGFLRRE